MYTLETIETADVYTKAVFDDAYKEAYKLYTETFKIQPSAARAHAKSAALDEANRYNATGERTSLIEDWDNYVQNVVWDK